MPRRRNCDISYFVAKELLMTERTYKRDLELVTVVSTYKPVLSVEKSKRTLTHTYVYI